MFNLIISRLLLVLLFVLFLFSYVFNSTGVFSQLLLLTVATTVRLQLLLGLQVERFNGLGFAEFLLEPFGLLLFVMIILVFTPCKAELLMDGQLIARRLFI